MSSSSHPPLVAPTLSIRAYGGEQAVHAHDHAQLLFALRGRMDLEVGRSCDVADDSSGLVIPAGTTHGYLASPDLRMVVIDAPPQRGLERARRFAVTEGMRRLVATADAARLLATLLDAPRIGVRRGLSVDALRAELRSRLHEPWTTARMAGFCALSPQRFHARLLETTGASPQAWLRAMRLDAAQRLLRRGLTLDAAAARVGYATASALAHALRRDRAVGARDVRGTRAGD